MYIYPYTLDDFYIQDNMVDMAPENPKDIWILAEVDGEGLREVVFELASEAHKMADKLGERLCAVLLAGDLKYLSKYLSRFGIDTIYSTEREIELDLYPSVISYLIHKYKPRLFLMGATPVGNECSPIIAARNEIGIITECLIFGLNNRGYFEATKMIYGDKVFATFEIPSSKPLIVTVIPGAFDLIDLGPPRDTVLIIESVEIETALARRKYLDFVRGDPKNIDISEAEIVVALGGGIGGHAGLKKIERLAEMIHGSLGGSRVAVDQGWLPFERQIGQTGKKVSPKLFVSCGISGAFEFSAGIRDSRLIVAINNDPNAPIFKISDLSLIEDLHIIIPEIIERLEKRLDEGTK